MTGALIVCVSLLVGTGEIGHKATDTAPFSVGRVVEEVSRNAGHSSRRGSLLGDWEHAVGSGLLEEFMIDTTITYVSGPSDQRSPSIAFGGGNYLVVWWDQSMGSIYGSRVDTSGAVLDPSGIAICRPADDQNSPSVAFDGSNYFVVWADGRNRGGSFIDIYGARIDTNGTVLDTLGIAISTASDLQMDPSVAFDGTNYFVVWHDSRAGQLEDDIYGARVNTSGIVIDTSGIAISTASDRQWDPSVAFNGVHYLVVWQDHRSGERLDIYGARVNTSGIVVDSSAMAICVDSNDQSRPSVAFNGANCLVAWSDNRSGSDHDIYCARVDTSGTVLDPSGVAVCTAIESQYWPSVAFDGANCLVVWKDRRTTPYGEVYGARVDTSGQVLDTSGIIISSGGNKGHPRVASSGTNLLIVWDEDWTPFSDVYGARVDTSVAVLDTFDILVTISAHEQYYPSVASDGAGYFAVWSDGRNEGDRDIYGMRVSETGAALDSSAIAISSVPDARNDNCPAVAFDGNNYFVVWLDLRGSPDFHRVYGARVDRWGAVLDSPSIAICSTACESEPPSVVSYGHGCVVAWSDKRTDQSYDIYGTRVDTNGAVLDPTGVPICTTFKDRSSSPSAAFDGTNCLVVWRNYRPPDTTEIRGARVDTIGTVLDPSGIAISTSSRWEDSPSVAFDGTNYLVVWRASTHTSYDIFGARVDTSGAVLDSSEIDICTALGSQYSPSVVFDGSDYLVAWHDMRSGLGWDIYGTRVTTSGDVLDPSGLRLISEPYSQFDIDTQKGSGNQVLLVSHGFAPNPYFNSRVFGALYTGVGIDEKIAELDVERLRVELFQNKPNPFNGRTVIGYSVPANAPVTLKVYNSSGRLMKVLVDNEKSAGQHSVIWNGRDTYGRELPSGIYFYRLQTGESTLTRKMIFLR